MESIKSREKIISDLHRELVGPDPVGAPISCAGTVKFAEENWKGIYGPWTQGDKTENEGEEILCIEPPVRRYGVGVLYPITVKAKEDEKLFSTSNDGIAEVDIEQADEAIAPTVSPAEKDLGKIEKRQGRGAEFSEEDERSELALANSRNPNALGISFLAYIPDDGELSVTMRFGRYEQLGVTASRKNRSSDLSKTWWLRRQYQKTFVIQVSELKSSSVPRRKFDVPGTNVSVSLDTVSRTTKDPKARLITISMVNRTEAEGSANAECIFQCELLATIAEGKNNDFILPYPNPRIDKDQQANQYDENAGFDLLYRSANTFSVGHGCCGNWECNTRGDRAKIVFADVLPKVRIPNVTADVLNANGKPIEVSMRSLAGLDPEDDGFASIEMMLNAYETWIKEKRTESNGISILGQKLAADHHVRMCTDALVRMRSGLSLLRSNNEENAALRIAFKWANEAMLLQQLRSSSKPRTVAWDNQELRLEFGEPAANRDVLAEASNKGRWRAFQIAFLLLSLESTANGDDPFRRAVDLIWFPTGGGKTEAYLGLSAFSIFLRRLRNVSDVGTQILMRYTLRLLTAQQFQRASTLICAMEVIRKRHPEQLGETAIRIGIWLGRDMTPNTREDAKQSLRQLTDRHNRANKENRFVLLRCPWCNAPLGEPEFKRLTHRQRATAPSVLGYRESNGTVIYHCPDSKCSFHQRLPVVTVDEDIYDQPPEIIIGTVDKFAQLSWDPRARTIFGLNMNGERTVSPPGLIIQDELHLISGPLGSMVGIYELAIEELCTDHRHSRTIPPKIITSTATIRHYREQIRALFGRDKSCLFPPPGLHASENFFSRPATDGEGRPSHKIYVGVHGAALGSLQTAQVRVTTSLLQSPLTLPEAERDPWWTLLCFFNSLRELGTTVSLFQSDIPYRLEILKNRYQLDRKNLRRLNKIKELTSRLNNSEVPKAIDELSTGFEATNAPIDACLSSSIIEVGVDIDRLSLMTIVGQPKTTAQYIQVSGRVGRRWWERPGLIVTLLSPSKPRDRSHYEKFRSFHERLYAEVEPTSVTPFSPPAVDRALHAVLAAFVRQTSGPNTAVHPMPFPEALVEKFAGALRVRVEAVDPSEWVSVKKKLDQRIREWKSWHREYWDARGGHREVPLMRMSGAYASKVVRERSWPTQNTMRNVDAECRMMISQLYTPAAERTTDVD